MRNFRTALYGLVGAAALASASDVHELTKDTFNEFVSDNELVLAEFFAPWCGHCKALAPEYEEAATQLKEKNIKLAKVDCTAHGELCSDHGVEGYPTLKVFRGLENISPYQGQRKADAIISYMTKQSMPAVSTLSKDTITDFKTADKVVLVAFFDKDDKATNETFSDVAKNLRDEYLFGATNDVDVAKAEGVKQPAIVVYKSFDDGKDIYKEKKIEKEALQKFIKAAATPLVGEVGPETYTGYMTSGLPLAYIFAETPEEREKLAKELKPIAEKHKGAINFATIDAKTFGQHGANLNLEVGKWPAFAIQDTVKNQKFPLDQEEKLTVKTVGKYVDDFAAGKVKPSIKSEPTPESQDSPVHVVVANTYEQDVIENDQDVLLEFYAPWCGHCKALAPKYEELGSLYQKGDFAKKVKIAKIDATANDVPDEIAGFPTIKLYRAGKKTEPVEYSGSRSVEDLAKFIAEQGTHGVDAYTAPKVDDEKDDQKPMQAPAASEKVDEAKDKVKDSVKDKVKGAAEKAKEVVMDGDEGVEGHDEL
ncbi:prolyl 4-hydroxylase, beta polypeptide [Phyllosticta citribraziliensis]|uniref:Protein disulfide-isomerase n=1 Tax=Phyllosticta citribraziliensis TaxID=989973 RepID=A0ABR1L3L3_9PEZI